MDAIIREHEKELKEKPKTRNTIEKKRKKKREKNDETKYLN